MVITRSSTNRNSRIERTEMNTFSDEDSNTSKLELSSRDYFAEINEEAMRSIRSLKVKNRTKVHGFEQTIWGIT